MEYPYDISFQPPAPVVPIRFSVPGSDTSVEVQALLDSGADISVMPIELVQRLQLSRVDVLQVQGFSTDPQEVPVFAAELALEGYETRISRFVSWGETYALLGRDVMNRWRIVLDGPTQTTSVG